MTIIVKLVYSILVVGLVLLLQRLQKMVRLSPEMKRIPSAPMLYIAYRMLTGASIIHVTDEFMSELREHGIARVWVKGTWQILVADAELTQRMLLDQEQFPKMIPGDYIPNSLIDKIFGTNVVFSGYHAWKRHRKVVNPAFKKAWNIQVFVDCVEQLFERMEQSPETNVDIHDYIQRVTVEALGREMMDVQFNGILPNEKPEFVNIFNELISSSVNVLYFIFYYLDKPWNPFRAKAYQNLAYINDYFDQLLKERKQTIAESKGDEVYKDVLSLMLKSNIHDPDGLTDQEIIHNTLMFFLAGQDTTAFSLCAALHLLAEHPEIQERARQEVILVLGKDEYEDGKMKVPTHEQLGQLDYVYSVIKEAMRMYPALSMIPNRYCSKEFKFKDYTIPAGTMMDINVYAIHRNPDYFPNPNTFDPSRFLNGAININNLKSNWFAFSGASRICLGNGFSTMQQKVVLSHILRRYTIKPTGSLPSRKPLPVHMPVLLAPHNLRLDFERISIS